VVGVVAEGLNPDTAVRKQLMAVTVVTVAAVAVAVHTVRTVFEHKQPLPVVMNTVVGRKQLAELVAVVMNTVVGRKQLAELVAVAVGRKQVPGPALD